MINHVLLLVLVLLCRYEDGDTTLRKLCSASDFIWSDAPLDILGSVTSITFNDPACLSIKDHALTTEEVQFSHHDGLQCIGCHLIQLNYHPAVIIFGCLYRDRLKPFVMICMFWESKTLSIF